MSAGILSAFLFGLLALSSACYFQNCPRGGKRSVPATPSQLCMSCGPNNRGICFGPHICCVGDQGCYSKTAWSVHCPDENLNPIPCEGSKAPCDGNGRCGYTGICCTDARGFSSTEC